MRRIARGVFRYVIENPKPFIVTTAFTNTRASRTFDLSEPLRTVTSQNEHALVTPYLVRIGQTGGNGDYANSAAEPLRTMVSKNEHLIVVPSLVHIGNGEREGQAPRAMDIEKPLGTVVAGGGKHALVAAFLAQHNTGSVGHGAEKPVSTICSKAPHQQLVTSHLVKLKGTCKDGQPVTQPMPTVQAGGLHVGEVRAFLIKYYGTGGQHQKLTDPMHTLPANDRIGLVMVHGEPYQIVDIGMRMLTPRELASAQGFPADYILDTGADGRKLTKTAQVRMIGNSVCPPIAEALVRANFAHEIKTKRKAA